MPTEGVIMTEPIADPGTNPYPDQGIAQDEEVDQ